MTRAGKDEPIAMGKRDHSHTCCVCGGEWLCAWFTEKQCRSKGVYKAMKINKGGPYCHGCQTDEMDRRVAAHRSEQEKHGFARRAVPTPKRNP